VPHKGKWAFLAPFCGLAGPYYGAYLELSDSFSRQLVNSGNPLLALGVSLSCRKGL
jgi:hypothetical protein